MTDYGDCVECGQPMSRGDRVVVSTPGGFWECCRGTIEHPCMKPGWNEGAWMVKLDNGPRLPFNPDELVVIEAER